MALGMMRQISTNIQKATFCTIVAGETAIVANKEHLVIWFGVWVLLRLPEILGIAVLWDGTYGL